MNSSGKYEHGVDTNGGSRTVKTRTTRLVGSIDSGKDTTSRLTGTARARRRFVKTVSMLLVVCAAAIVVVSAVALTEASQASISTKAPPPTPYTIYGYSYAADGVTPMPGSVVVVTNTRTGEFTTWNDTHDGWDPLSNIYSIDLSEMPTAWVAGDIINVTSTNGIYIGWNESAVTDNPSGFDQIDVTLNGTPIPEFPMVILPVGGMIVLFAVVSLRRKDKEQ